MSFLCTVLYILSLKRMDLKTTVALLLLLLQQLPRTILGNIDHSLVNGKKKGFIVNPSTKNLLLYLSNFVADIPGCYTPLLYQSRRGQYDGAYPA